MTSGRMHEFFRFPHTPHLAWLGHDKPRDDKVMSPADAAGLMAADVVVEEKLDGANIGFSILEDGSLLAQNRGQYLVGPHAGQFSRLPAWLKQHGEALRSVLTPDLMLFGEWCAARHSLDYVALPDWYLLFDVYDRRVGRFWSSTRRNALAMAANLATVPRIAQGRQTMSALKTLVATSASQFREGPLEGVIIRQDSEQWCESRAKLVRAGFTQQIVTHWRKRTIEWNRCLGMQP